MNSSGSRGRDGIRVSDEAVRNATGRGWDEWEEALDGWGAAELSHKEIVALLGERGGVESGWWRQSIANGFEKLKGKRAVGETDAAGFQIGVQRTVPISHRVAWRLLTSQEGVRTWLGDASGLQLGEGSEGNRYRIPPASSGGIPDAGDEKASDGGSREGAQGEVRVFHPDRHLRITWQPEAWARPSTIQVRVEPKGEKTVIGFHEENLPGPEEREARRAHFRSALDRLQKLARDL